jgi:hypothetical protein
LVDPLRSVIETAVLLDLARSHAIWTPCASKTAPETTAPERERERKRKRKRETGKRKKSKNKKLKLSPKIIEKHKFEDKPKVTSMTSFSSSILVGFGRSSPGRNAGARGALRRASATEVLPGRRHGGARVSWATSDAANNSSSCANIVGSVESFHGMNWEVG